MIVLSDKSGLIFDNFLFIAPAGFWLRGQNPRQRKFVEKVRHVFVLGEAALEGQ